MYSEGVSRLEKDLSVELLIKHVRYLRIFMKQSREWCYQKKFMIKHHQKNVINMSSDENEEVEPGILEQYE